MSFTEPFSNGYLKESSDSGKMDVVAIVRPYADHTTGGDNYNKRCFGTKPKLFRESGDFSGNRDTWKFSRKHAIIPGQCRKKNRDIRECIPKIREDDSNFRDDLS